MSHSDRNHITNENIKQDTFIQYAHMLLCIEEVMMQHNLPASNTSQRKVILFQLLMTY